MLTRSQVATMLGKSIATVRRMEGHDLHPSRNHAGVHLFDPEEVRAVRRYSGTGSVLPPSQRPRRRAWLEQRDREEPDRDAGIEEQSQSLAPEQLAHLLHAAREEGARAERFRLDAQRTLEQDIASRQRDTEEQALAKAKAEAIEFLATLSDRDVRRLARDPEFQWLLDELDS